MAYANWADLAGRYREFSKIGDDSEINSYHIAHAENELNGIFAGCFTVPFSSNNITVKFLTVDLTYIKYYESIDQEKAEGKRKSFDSQVKRIKNGMGGMVLDDGTILRSSLVGGVTAYSSTADYHPVFGIGNIEDMRVDSSQLIDEEDAR